MPFMPQRALGTCSYESKLKKEIIDKGRCCLCGTCGAVCPKVKAGRRYNPLSKAALGDDGDGEACELCLETCPIHNHRVKEGLGDIVSLWRAKATDKSVLERCQDGGACTAFLNSLEGLVGLTVGMDGWKPTPLLSSTIDSAGSKYGASSSVSMLPLRKDVAFVGLPCQIQGIGLAQERGLLKEVKLKIGLFCTKNFHHDKFNDVLLHEGIDLNNVKKIDIKGKIRLTTLTGSEVSLPLSKFEDSVLGGCSYCKDYCSFFSDISFGSAGSEDGYTTVITRSKKADELFNMALQKGFIIADKNIDTKEISLMQEKKREQNG